MKKILSIIIIASSIIFTMSFAAPKAEITLQGLLAYKASNYQKALKLLTKASNAGNPNASEVLSQMYYNGQGVKQDYNKAMSLLQLAVNNGNPEAYYGMGQLYYFGEGVAENKAKGIDLYTKAANAGYNVAQAKLGAVYSAGKNAGLSDQNIPLSYYWYNVAWANGAKDTDDMTTTFNNFLPKYPYCIALGQDNVAQAYLKGIGGLEQSKTEALNWMEKAAQTDPSLGVVNLDLAKMYHNTGNDNQAFKYAQKAATQPYAPAMQYLGTMYQQGIGTSQNNTKAYAYLSLAVELYNNPDDKFYAKYKAPCMPNYKQTTTEFNKDVAQGQLDNLSSNMADNAKAEKLLKSLQVRLAKAK